MSHWEGEQGRVQMDKRKNYFQTLDLQESKTLSSTGIQQGLYTQYFIISGVQAQGIGGGHEPLADTLFSRCLQIANEWTKKQKQNIMHVLGNGYIQG
mmetsp:Transcript_29415/g.71693  ORF Transcript_29415/g.71693 Transcript_29415/m.71693 type:complete len:97 (+) Transcript_29415:3661-3951(+)